MEQPTRKFDIEIRAEAVQAMTGRVQVEARTKAEAEAQVARLVDGNLIDFKREELDRCIVDVVEYKYLAGVDPSEEPNRLRSAVKILDELRALLARAAQAGVKIEVLGPLDSSEPQRLRPAMIARAEDLEFGNDLNHLVLVGPDPDALPQNVEDL